MQRTPSRAAAILTITALGALALVAVPTPEAAQARIASAGAGRFVDAIDWVEWGTAQQLLPRDGFTGTTTRRVEGDTITTTCVGSDPHSAQSTPGSMLRAYRPGTWQGDSLDELYNIGGTGNNNQLISGLANVSTADLVDFLVTCSAVTGKGVPVALEGLVVADAEQSGTIEFVAATPSTPGAVWRLIDRSRTAGCTASTTAILDAASNRLELRGDARVGLCASGPSVVAFLDGATSARVEVRGNAVSAIALGVVLPLDHGDAPASYGEAGHDLSPEFTGGQLPVGTTSTVSDNTFALATAPAPRVRLGATVDPENASNFSADASGDNQDGTGVFGPQADEDGLTSGTSIVGAVGDPYSATVACGPGGGSVAGWIDWNRDGDFADADERSETSTCAAGAARVTWVAVPSLDRATAGTPTYLRLRIAAAASDILRPTGLALTGEVEDYRVLLNVTQSITVNKVVTSRAYPADQFSFGVVGVSSGQTSGAATTATTGPAIVPEGVSYQIRETIAPGSTGTFSDYRPATLTCVGVFSGASVPVTGTGPTWTLPPLTRLDRYVCTITNEGFQPAIGLDLSVAPVIDQDGNGPDAGDEVAYAFTVTNTGNVQLTAADVANIAFSGTGPRPAVVCPPLDAPLAPGAQIRCTATYTLTQADVDAGTVTNAATATGDVPGSLPNVTSAPALGAVPIARAPGISVVKSASLPGGSRFAAGQVITYTFLAKNTGNTTLTGVTVADVAFSGTGPAPVAVCPGDTLAPGAQLECTATYTLTVADIDQAEVANSATATGTPPAGLPPVTSAASSVTIPTPDDASLELTKTVAPSTGVREGDTVTYTFVLQNTGNVTVSGAAITEGSFTGTEAAPTIDCPAGAGTLAPGERLTCSAPYRVTAADVGNGSIDNTATATAQSPGGPVSAPDASATLQLPANPSITLQTSVDRGTASAAGDAVTYSFLITNTGDVTLYNAAVPQITFTGSAALGPLTCPAAASALAPGQSVTCTAPYTLTQADVDAGRVDSTGVATGTPAGRIPAPTSAPSSAAVTIAAAPALTLDKTATPDVATAAGAAISYSFLVTNTGNVTLSNVSIDEREFTGAAGAPSVSCPVGAASLAPAASVACTASYVLTQADIDAGGLDNTAAARATAPGATSPTVSAEDRASVSAVADPGLSLVKEVSGVLVEGATATYSFRMTNTGNLTLADAAPVEGAFSGTGTVEGILCPAGAAQLLPGQVVTCTADYVVTAADVASGAITNTASATAEAPGGPVAAPDSPATLAEVANPAIALATSVDPGTASVAGDSVTYSFLITNIGDEALNAVTASPTAFTGTGALGTLSCPPAAAALAPGESVTCTARYVLTQADVDSGRIDITAVATGTPGGSAAAPMSAPSGAAVAIAAAPALTLDKTVSPDAATAAGTVVTYSFLLTNTGNVTLSNATVDEGDFTGGGPTPVVACPAAAASLAPSDTVTCTADYVLTPADIDGGGVSNTAVASGTAPGATAATVSPADTASVRVTAAGGLSLVTSAAVDQFAAGEIVSYSFVVTNTGSVTVTGIALVQQGFTGSGAAPVLVCPSTELAPGEQMTCRADYTLTDADVVRGSVENAASATGVTLDGAVVESLSEGATVTVASAAPPGPGTGAGPGPGGLARTGSTGIPSGVVVALALLVAGCALVLTGRRPVDSSRRR